MKEQIIAILNSYRENGMTSEFVHHYSFQDVADEIIALFKVAEMPTEEEFTQKMAEIDCNTTDFFDWASQLYIWFCNRIKGEKK